jgi:hypothetical protein
MKAWSSNAISASKNLTITIITQYYYVKIHISHVKNAQILYLMAPLILIAHSVKNLYLNPSDLEPYLSSWKPSRNIRAINKNILSNRKNRWKL